MGAPDRGSGRHAVQEQPAGAHRAMGIAGALEQAKADPDTGDADGRRQHHEKRIVVDNNAGQYGVHDRRFPVRAPHPPVDRTLLNPG